jgi:hypothetical protein
VRYVRVKLYVIKFLVPVSAQLIERCGGILIDDYVFQSKDSTVPTFQKQRASSQSNLPSIYLYLDISPEI